MIKAKNMDIVLDALKKSPELFSPREKQILLLRYGSDGQSWNTLETVGKKIGITKERVRQIESKCLSRITNNP